MTRFVPCSSCRRHVRLDDAACPFCGGAVDASAARPEGLTGAGLSRAAALALGTALAAAACTPSGNQPNDPGAALYGGPPPASAKPEPSAKAPNPDDTAMAAMYGMATPTPAVPPPGASSGPKQPPKPPQPSDATGPVAAYGAPPPPMPTPPPPPPAPTPPKKK